MKYIKLFEEHKAGVNDPNKMTLDNFKGKNLIHEIGDYKVFLIDEFEEIENFNNKLAICHRKQYFDMYNEKDFIHFIFKNDQFKYAFSIDRESYNMTLLVDENNRYIIGGSMNDFNTIPEDDRKIITGIKNVYEGISDKIIDLNK